MSSNLQVVRSGALVTELAVNRVELDCLIEYIEFQKRKVPVVTPFNPQAAESNMLGITHERKQKQFPPHKIKRSPF